MTINMNTFSGVALKTLLLSSKVVLGVLILAGAAVADGEGYQLIVDQEMFCGDCAIPLSINNSGEVAGLVLTGPPSYNHTPQIWNGKSGGKFEVRSLSGLPWGGVRAINDSGISIGYRYGDLFTESDSPATMWAADGSVTNLGSLMQGYTASANALNNSGAVALSSQLRKAGKVVQHAAIWRDGVMTDLDPDGLPPPGVPHYSSAGYGINDAGTVVGTRGTYVIRRSSFRAIKWKDGVMIELGTLVRDNGRRSDAALDINNDEVAVGYSGAEGRSAAVKWVGYKISNLGGPHSPNYRCEAKSINNRGAIIGACDNVAVLWAGGRAKDLNSFLSESDRASWTLFDATSINDRGEIIGLAVPHGATPGYGSDRFFLLTPK